MHIQPHTLQLLILTASYILAVMAYKSNFGQKNSAHKTAVVLFSWIVWNRKQNLAESGIFWDKFALWGGKNWKLYSYFHGLDCGARGHGLFSVLLLSTLPKLSLYFIRKSQQNIIILTVNTKKLAYFELQFLFTKMKNLFSLEL